MRHYLLPVWPHTKYMSAAQDLCLAPGEWWNQAPLRYPHALISYPHWQQPFEFPADAHIFGDSGGFRLLAKRPEKIDPIDVLYWQAKLCTNGCILDLPARSGDWGRALRVTVDHVRRALPEYQLLRAAGSPFRWWGVIQGNDEAHALEWYRAICDLYPFTDDGEGWAIYPGPRPTPETIARSMGTLQLLGIRNAHFLMCTGQEVIATMLALGSWAGLQLLTFDSTYAVKTGFNRLAFRPTEDGITFSLLREEKDERQVRDFLMSECTCTACVFMRERSKRVAKARFEFDRGIFGGWWSGWTQIHNLHIQQKLTATLAREAQADSERLLRTILKPKVHSVVMNVVERVASGQH